MSDTEAVPPPENSLDATLAHSADSRGGIDAQARIGSKIGNHRVTGILGRGGMGVVFGATDERLARQVAIKIVPTGMTRGTDGQRVLQEARAVARLSHSNVVGIFEVGEQDGETYFVLEFVEGGSLADLLDRGEPLSWRAATRLIADACRGLAAAHSAGLVHRDIKPANLLRTRDGQVKLTDFGLAKLAESLGTTLTATGTVLGTPAYMSPEQCQAEPLDARTDIYSLGATYYALLTGHGPYADSTSTPKVMFAHCYKPIPDPRAVDASIPEECSAVIRRAMAKAPAERYPNATAMLDDLERLLTGNPTTAVGLAPVPPRARSPVSRRAWILGAAGLAAAAVGVPGLIILSRRTGRTPRDPDPGRDPAPSTPVAAAPVPKGPPIRVGLLHSLSGTMAGSESAVVDGTLLAIEELNHAGGVLGRPIEPVVADGMSEPDVFAREAERLITRENVCTVFGCWTSASRKTVRPVFERHDHLLLYPLQYEGLEQSPNIVYLGATPNQQILPAVKWAYTDLGRKFFLAGSDYVFPRVAGAIIRDQVEALGGQIVGEEYRPLGSTDMAGIVRAIKEQRPDVILNTINGDSNAAFFRALRAAGITPTTIPTVSFSIAENEVRALGARMMTGDYAAWNYFESLDRPTNQAFLQRFHAKFGPQRLTSDPTEAAYFGVHLWAEALSAAGSVDPKAIREALRGRSYEAPEGPVKIDPTNQHTWKIARIGKINEAGDFDVFYSSDKPIAPQPFPTSRTHSAWEAFLADLYQRWGGRWSAPSA